MSMTNYDLPKDIANRLVDPQSYTNLDRLHEIYAWARANNPVGRAMADAHDPFWVVTKHADVSMISRNNALFLNGDYSVVCRPQASIAHVIGATGSPNIVRSLVHVDGDEHKSLRALTQSWFMPNSVVKLEARIRSLAHLMIGELLHQSGSVIDFANDFASDYPLNVIMDILGVPQEESPRMLRLTQEMFGSEDAEYKREISRQGDAGSAIGKALLSVVADFKGYFDRLTEDRRKKPRNDIATLLANAVIDGQPIDEATRLGYYVIIAAAGHDTVSSSISVAMWALCQFPHLLPRLKTDPSLIPQFIDESLRYASPVRHFMRTAAADTNLRGRTIRKGDWLMLCYGSANRDEEVFPDPFVFDIDRRSNRHIAFGAGAHVCLGQHLANMEMRILFEELIPKLQFVEPMGDIEFTTSNFVSGPKHLPIRCVLQ
ncbi:cytochrome P450 [Paraburkholderia sp. JPY432]|uniref:cytochrome P450 n=1 Tax=Paraburkholderia youngii TaxID=2782701 RepID=UPI0015953523|nr:cytochrome P450 [Paraburkholderia youngii]